MPRSPENPRPKHALVQCVLPLGLLIAAACAPQAEEAPAQEEAAAPPAEAPDSRFLELLKAGEPIFGIRAGEFTREQGALMAGSVQADFLFYSMENPPFDIPSMQAYVEGMVEAAGEDILREYPLMLRIPPIRDGIEEARERVQRGLDVGAMGIIYPHIEDGEDAALSVEFIGDVWPADPNGHLVDVIIIEDSVGIAHTREIVETTGLSVVFPGPGDLRRTYDGDMEATEAAIQKVLAACLEFQVPCGITAGVDDVVMRMEQGFQVFIVSDVEAVAVGREAAGQS